jgi:hypothetical protein
MKQEEIERLRYRRQYVLAPKEFNCPFLYNRYPIGSQYYLYSHIDLPVSTYCEQNSTVILLGDMFDFVNPEYTNTDILKNIIDVEFNNVVVRTAKYSGRYVLVFINKNTISLVHDLTACRKIYYGKFENNVWCASQPHLLAKILGIGKTSDQERLTFYNSPDFIRLFNSNVGNLTIYDGIFQVLPNHYFDLPGCKSVRYWPNSKIIRIPVNQAAGECSKMIKGYLKSIANRYELMIPITAGKDSRILLAATREYCDQVFYYINKGDDLTDKSSDIAVPSRLLSILGLRLNILDPTKDVDMDFQKVYFENNDAASIEFLPFIYNYYKHFSHKVNLPGNIASAGFEIFKFVPENVNAYFLAYSYKLSKYKFAVDYYEGWLKECKELCKENGINIMSLFYWEERLGNWGTQIQLEKDIAQEDFNPFNSRILVSYFLSVHHKYISSPYYGLHKRIILKLWPSALQVGINLSFKLQIKKVLYRLGLLKIVYRIMYAVIYYLKIKPTLPK